MELLFTIGLPLLVVGFVLGPVLWQRHLDARLLERGVSGQARVLEVIDTGDRMNKDPVVLLRLSVRGSDGAEFPAEIRTAASAVRLQTLKLGAELAVRYDPEQRDRVAIDDRKTFSSAP